MRNAILALALLAPSALAAAPASAPAAAAPVPAAYPFVEGEGPKLWRVVTRCDVGPEPAEGEVHIHGGDTPPDLLSLPHVGLAMARACQTVAKGRIARKDYATAIAAIRAGMAALGQAYMDTNGADPTRLQERAASDRVASGSLIDGAQDYAAVLATRIDLYAKRFAAELAEAP